VAAGALVLVDVRAELVRAGIDVAWDLDCSSTVSSPSVIEKLGVDQRALVPDLLRPYFLLAPPISALTLVLRHIWLIAHALAEELTLCALLREHGVALSVGLQPEDPLDKGAERDRLRDLDLLASGLPHGASEGRRGVHSVLVGCSNLGPKVDSKSCGWLTFAYCVSACGLLTLIPISSLREASHCGSFSQQEGLSLVKV
jgi:hypothetical protein